MITAISINGFKSLREVSLKLGELNIFVGTNASGKTNFFDALRVLQGIGYGFNIEEILNGKPKTASSEVWAPIRGGSGNVGFVKWDPEAGKSTPSTLRFSVTMREPYSNIAFDYSIKLSALRRCVLEESLIAGGSTIYDSGLVGNVPESPTLRVRYYAGKPGRQPHLSFEKSRPVLHQILRRRDCSKQHEILIEQCTRLMSNTQRLDPSPATLRDYAQAPVVPRMGERGENFAALVDGILKDPSSASAYTSWLKQLTPAEMDEVKVLHGALQEPLFALRNHDRDFPAPVLSDGTLRFAAIAAAFFQQEMPEILMIEEIENGIHPSRLRLLVELLKSQAASAAARRVRRSAPSTLANLLKAVDESAVPQLIVTTHSPIVLSWLSEKDYQTTFFCKKDETTGASTILPLSEIPNFIELVRKQPITDLFAEGWLEGAL